MAKLQRIKRSNGSVVFSVNLPLDIIEGLGFEKGDELNIENLEDGGIRISKVEGENDG